MRILDSIGNLASDDFRMAAAMGHIPGWRPLRKFGFNEGVPSTGSEDVWSYGTPRVWPSSAAVAAISSSSAEDDPVEATPPGTGAWTITVEGLNSSFEEVSETKTLTGTTPVNTTQTFLRINRAYVVTAGSTGSNVGDITITVSSQVQAFIPAGFGQTQQSHYTVPANHVWVIDYYSVGIGRMAGTSDAQIKGFIRLNGGTSNESWRVISAVQLYNGGNHSNESSITILPAKTDAYARVTSTATTQAYAIIGGYLVQT